MGDGSATTRRRVLTGVCGAATVAIAGCLGGDDENGGSGPSGEDVASAMSGTSFAFEGGGTISGNSGSATMDISGHRTADGDQYIESTSETMGVEQSTEIYVVDGTTYTITQGSCSEGSSQQTVPLPAAEELDFLSDMESSGTETIDGTDVDVYQASEGQMGDGAGEATLYIDGDNYIRRIEMNLSAQGGSGEISFDYHSYGDSFSVEVPDSC